MKKKIFIIIILCIVSIVLYNTLRYVVNTQILSRILYGMDFDTYINLQMKNINSLLSNDKIPYEWVFTISNYIILALCIIVTYITTKKIGEKYALSKKEFIIVMIIFSILSLYESIFSLITYHRIISFQILQVPILFIITAIIGSYKNIYKNRI